MNNINHHAPIEQPGQSQLFVEELQSNPNMYSEVLYPDKPFLIDPIHGGYIADVISTKTETTQTLLAVISAGGDEQFGIIQMVRFDGDKSEAGYVISRLAKNPDERATIVGTVSDEAGVVGRTGLVKSGAKDVADTLSREHFSASLSEEGYVVITAMDTPNGTLATIGNSHHERVKSRVGVWCPPTEDVKNSLEHAPDASKKHVSIIKEVVEVEEHKSDDKTREEQFKELEAGISEEDAILLWRFASKTLKKEDAQNDDRGFESSTYGHEAGQALGAMSEAAKERAQKYLSLMRQR